MNELTELGVYDAIVKHLKDNMDAKKEGVLELNCGDGQLAELLKEAGIKKYHGVDPSEDAIEAAKKRVSGYSKRFHVGDTKSEEALNHKSEVLVCLRGTPYEIIEPGQRLIVLTRGQSSWDECCLALAPLFQEGAKTVQHGELFLTFGVRK